MGGASQKQAHITYTTLTSKKRRRCKPAHLYQSSATIPRIHYSLLAKSQSFSSLWIWLTTRSTASFKSGEARWWRHRNEPRWDVGAQIHSFLAGGGRFGYCLGTSVALSFFISKNSSAVGCSFNIFAVTIGLGGLKHEGSMHLNADSNKIHITVLKHAVKQSVIHNKYGKFRR